MPAYRSPDGFAPGRRSNAAGVRWQKRGAAQPGWAGVGGGVCAVLAAAGVAGAVRAVRSSRV